MQPLAIPGDGVSETPETLPDAYMSDAVPLTMPNGTLADPPDPVMVGERPAAASMRQNTVPWLFAAFLSHTGFGIYPVCTRYLQVMAPFLQPFSIIAIANAAAFLLTFPAVARQPAFHIRDYITPRLFLLCCIASARTFTLVIASRLTTAIIVQIIALLNPFLVAVLSGPMLGEIVPRAVLVAMTMCVCGALLAISSDMRFSFSSSDGLGIVLSVVTMAFLAFYVILARKFTRGGSFVVANGLILSQFIITAAVGLVLSLAVQEEWGRWGQCGLDAWLVFLSFFVFSVLGGNIIQLWAIRRVSASILSGMLPWRLIVAALLSTVLLQEQFTSWNQFLGAAVVIVSVLGFMALQHRQAASRSPAKGGRGDSEPLVQEESTSSSPVSAPMVAMGTPTAFPNPE